MTSALDLSKEELREQLGDVPNYRVDQIWQGLYTHGRRIDEVTSLPAALRERLGVDFPPALDPTTVQTSSSGDTVKRLWTLDDGNQIESVLMHYRDRSTVCISSQAGCAMACDFCATGQAGYFRNLTVGEMLEQVIAAKNEAAPKRLSNIVYMGMGEPFANYDRVVTSLHRIIDDIGIGARKITVSTVGLVPQMRRFAEEGMQVGLAVSLHAANDADRSAMIPINKRHPIADVVAAARYFRETTGRRVSFEWAMIDGVNDKPSDVAELAQVAREAHAHVNLIPLNPTPGYPTLGTPKKRIYQFAKDLEERGVTATVRGNRGTDIDAACGQLATAHKDRKTKPTESVGLEIKRTPKPS